MALYCVFHLALPFGADSISAENASSPRSMARRYTYDMVTFLAPSGAFFPVRLIHDATLATRLFISLVNNKETLTESRSLVRCSAFFMPGVWPHKTRRSRKKKKNLARSHGNGQSLAHEPHRTGAYHFRPPSPCN